MYSHLRLAACMMATVLAALALPAAASAVETQPVPPDALAQRMEAVAQDVTQGALRVVKPTGEVVECPLKHTAVQATVSGFLARVKVTQTFLNPLQERIEAVYVFPLPHKSAVDDVTMVIGDRRIIGLIKRRAEARQIYEQALAAGMTAALLEQERPNIFTQSVGNIDPGQEVKIEISYVDVLEYDMGTYEFHFPMVVGPRYIPGGATSAIPPVPPELKGKVGELDKKKVREGTEKPKGAGWAPDTDRVPDASHITPPVLKPGVRNGHDISLEVTLDAGVPIQDLRVTSHEAAIQRTGKSQAAVKLSPADSIPNKAFVLRYDVSGKMPEMACLAHVDGKGQGYFMLMIQPADDERLRQAPPREIVFLCDVSGSMSGEPTAKVVDAMGRFLKLCKPEDTVQVITFESQSQKLFPAPVPVTEDNIKRALGFTQGLRGGGGTEMLRGIRMVLDEPPDPKRVRIVIMMTDGFIGNEAEIIAEVGRRAGDRIRFWCIGIGSDPNRFLLDGVARQGGGMSKTLGLRDDPQPMVQEVMLRIHRAQLSAIEIDWAGLKVFETYPARIPELWAGRPVVLFGLYGGGGREATVRINGQVEGQPVSWPLAVFLPANENRNEVLAKVWARHKIEDLMQQTFYAGSPEIEDVVTSIALEYRLMSQYTSFVAVDQRDVGKLREPARPPRRMLVPVPLPEGTRYEGFFGEMNEDADGLVADGQGSSTAAPMFGAGFKMAKQSAGLRAIGVAGGGMVAADPTSGAKHASLSPAAPARAFAGFARGDSGRGSARGGRPAAGAYSYFAVPSEPAPRAINGEIPFADASKSMDEMDSDGAYTANALAADTEKIGKRAQEVLAAAQELQKKGDLAAARAKFTLAYLLSSAADGQATAKALEGIEKTSAELLKTWTKELPGLDKPLALVIRDKSVADALAAVAEAAGLRVRLIPGSVEDAAAIMGRRDLRVTYLDLRNATVAQALDWILTPLRMTWQVEKGQVVAGTVRRASGESAWVYDVSLMALPSAAELNAIKDSAKRIEAAKQGADAIAAAVRKTLGVKEDAVVWYAPGLLLVAGDAKVHESAARLLADLADPAAKIDGRLAELQKVTSKRAESRKDPAAKLLAAAEKLRIAHALAAGSWQLVAAATRGELDLEALTEVEVAWARPETAEFLKGPGATTVLRSFWAITEAARALPKEPELAVAAKSARQRSQAAAEAAMAALEKSPADAAAYFQVLYAAMAMRDDSAYLARAQAALAKGEAAKLGRWPTIAAALVGPADKIDAKALGEVLTELLGLGNGPAATLEVANAGAGVGVNDVMALTALGCRRAGGDAWNKFRAESKDLLGRRPLAGSVVILINSLSRPNVSVAAATR